MEQKDKLHPRRLFIALDIPEDAKAKLLLSRDAVQLKGKYRWEAMDKIHLTLNFIGDVEEDKIPLINKVLDETLRFKSFHCKITRFGFFFKSGDPKILYAVLEVDRSIYEIEKFLSERLKNFDILTDRKPYKPHLTLLKIKGKTEEGFIESITSYKFETISFLAQEIVLYESALNITGSTYKRLKTIYLST